MEESASVFAPGAGAWLARIAVVALPALLFVGLHVRALDYPLVWTDISAIGEGTMIRPTDDIGAAFFEPLHRIEFRTGAAQQPYYRPLQVVLLSLVGAVAGDAPRAYRAATLGVGALCIVAFGWFARSLLGANGPALFAAAFVAAHPVLIESSVWISGVSGALCAMFTIAALGASHRSLEAGTRHEALLASGVSILCLIAGLLSKERAAVEPLLLLAWVVSIASGPDGASRAALRRGAMLAGSHLVVVAVYLLAWRPEILGQALPSLPYLGASQWTQLLTAAASWTASLAWLFAPLQSTTSDVVPIVDRFADARPWLGVACAAGSFAAWIALLRSGRRVAAFGLAWIWIAFAPTSGVLPMLHLTGERYRLLSAFGVALLLADLGPALLRRFVGAKGAVVAAVCGAAVVVGLAERSWTRIPDWRSTQSLFGPALEREPAYREAAYLLAFDAHRAGDFIAADERLRPLIEHPERFAGTASYWNPLSVYELACSNALARGRGREILALDRVAQRDRPELRSAPTFRACVGQAHDALGQIPQALAIYLEVASQLGSTTPPRLVVLIAHKLIEMGRYAEARTWLTRARSVTAGSPELESHVAQLEAHLKPSQPETRPRPRTPPR